jgi:2-polyprenyl-6-hydroxyphenyl methylase/3-demethylubiquinone-9 3-methyltransferase
VAVAKIARPFFFGMRRSMYGHRLVALAQNARNKFRGFLQAYGTATAKRFLWNVEFSRGRWSCLESSPGDVVYPYIEKYANQGSILDLGCGSGSTGNELDPSAYRDYTGVDISDVAIEKAKTGAELNGRADKNEYRQSDLLRYLPTRQFDVILFRDSIYYVAPTKIKGMLERYSKYLKQNGVFIVRMYSADGKYRSIVDTIESSFAVLEKHFSNEPTTAVIVFRRQ